MCGNILQKNMASPRIEGFFDNPEERERLAERILLASPEVQNRARHRNYLLTLPAARLKERLQMIVAQSAGARAGISVQEAYRKIRF